MENASKALLIAGGVLIAMIIASFGVYLYGVYHSHAENVMNRLTESQITEFNAKFLAFEGRDLTVNEVVSIMNLIRNNNRTMTDDEYQISIEGLSFDIYGVNTNIKDIIEYKKDDKYIKTCNKIMILYSANEANKFKMEVSQYSNETGLVEKIKISQA